MGYVRKTNNTKKQKLLKIIGQLIKEKRLQKEKGILLLGYEYDVSGSSIMHLERGERDVQDILTRSQNRTEGILHLRGRDQGCFDHAFVPKEIVVLMTVKILGIGGAGN